MNEKLLNEWEQDKKEFNPNFMDNVNERISGILENYQRTGLSEAIGERLVLSEDPETQLRTYLELGMFERDYDTQDQEFKQRMGRNYLSLVQSRFYREFVKQALETSETLDEFKSQVWEAGSKARHNTFDRYFGQGFVQSLCSLIFGKSREKVFNEIQEDLEPAAVYMAQTLSQ